MSPEQFDFVVKHPAEMLGATPEHEKALALFFGEEYWKGVWVIQEITVARKVSILYGDHRLRWEDVATTLRKLLENLSTFSDKCTATAEAIKCVVHLLKFRGRYLERDTISLFDALVWSRRALSTDPRDKIFALLGLCHDGRTFVPVPNYKQDLMTIIAEMSKEMMFLRKNLDLICLRGVSDGDASIAAKNLPSWAANWPSVWRGTVTIQEDNILTVKSTSHKHSSTRDGSSNKVLKVRGAQVEVVTELASAFGERNRSSPSRKPQGWILSTSALTEEQPGLKLASNEIRNTIWAALTMTAPQRKQEVYFMPHEFPRQSKSTIAGFELPRRPEGRGVVEDLNLIQWIDDNAWLKVGPWTLREWSQAKPDNGPVNEPSVWEEKASKNFFSSIFMREQSVAELAPTKPASDLTASIDALHRVLSSGMRLVCIDFDQQCPVAMAHPDVEVGDGIFYLEGCSTPMVLRYSDIECQYMVVGGCHLPVHISDEFVVSRLLERGYPGFWTRQLDPIKLVLI